MAYQATITYSDNQSVNLVVPDDSIKEVINSIKEGGDSFYVFNEQTQVGVWSRREQIRHIIVQPYVEKKDEPETEDGDEKSN